MRSTGVATSREAALQWRRANFQISTDKARLQTDRVHAFLSQKAYWSQGVPRAVVEKAIDRSLCFGVYDEAQDLAPVES